MSWRNNNNKRINKDLRSLNIWFLKSEHANIKKFRARNWLIANKIRGIKK